METLTTKYEFTHGRKPSGNGCWFFSMLGTDNKGTFTEYTGAASGTLSVARREVARRFKAEVPTVKSIMFCEVLP